MSLAPLRDQEYRLFEANAQKSAEDASLPGVREKHLLAARHWGELAAREEGRARDRARRVRLVEARTAAELGT